MTKFTLLISMCVFSLVTYADDQSCLVNKMEFVGRDLSNTNAEESVALKTLEKTVLHSKKAKSGDDILVKISYKGMSTSDKPTSVVLMGGNTMSCAITSITILE